MQHNLPDFIGYYSFLRLLPRFKLCYIYQFVVSPVWNDIFSFEMWFFFAIFQVHVLHEIRTKNHVELHICFYVTWNIYYK